MNNWTIEQARKTYNVQQWGNGYFDLNDQGHLIAIPSSQQAATTVDLYQLADEIKKTGLSLPVLVRFTDILHDRVKTLDHAFQQAMKKNDYQGKFTGVYPIKVNQQRSVVKEILNVTDVHVGLEAGSKPELMAVLALSHKKDSIIICNGYKDREYIRLALIGRQLGYKVYLVIEKASELELIIEQAKALDIQPLIGIRVRLASVGAGNWQNTGGDKSKFGLSSTQALALIKRLKETGFLASLELLHFHMGSQLPNIRDIQQGLHECARYFTELHRLGVNIRTVDVGGGLGINYDGTRSRNFCSMNYTMQDYANCIVTTLRDACSKTGIPHPDIITESGRALTAHHAVLITNVVDSETAHQNRPDKKPEHEKPAIIQNLVSMFDALSETRTGNTPRSPIEIYNEAKHGLSEAQLQFNSGELTLEQRAYAEQLYSSICWKVRTILQAGTKAHRETLDELNETLADKYFCNFSIFKSTPDIWAISQIFPIVPLHRLDEAPSRRGRLHDITCDSDGRIDLYVDSEGIESSLPLHPLKNSEPYLIGIFLVGAYQEILGDMHNLFGDTNSINVVLAENGEYKLDQALRGDTVSSVLEFVKYDVNQFINAYEEKVDSAGLNTAQKKLYLEELKAGISGYTYLED
jgi:arginine decarboxylase